jgi:divalent metal cation (Fe/Co/Zn/Cd) transporter
MLPHDFVILILIPLLILIIIILREPLIKIIGKELLIYVIIGLFLTIIGQLLLWPYLNAFFNGLDGTRFVDKLYSYLFDNHQENSDPVNTLTFLIGVIIGLIVLLYTFEYIKRKGYKVLRLTDTKDKVIALIYYLPYLILIFILVGSHKIYSYLVVSRR